MTGLSHGRRNKTGLLHVFTLVLCAGLTDGLVDEKMPVEPTVSEPPAAGAGHTKACGNGTPSCIAICSLCDEQFPGEKVQCLSALIGICLSNFHTAMNHNVTDRCDWGHVSGFYSNLSICTEEFSDCLLIPWPNPLVEQLFLETHFEYFQDCPSEELSDPPPPIIFALVITPICLIPVMVSLVVFKTKNGDGSQ